MSCIECHPAIPHGSCSLTPCILTVIIIQAQNIIATTQSYLHSNASTSTGFLKIIVKILILIGTGEKKVKLLHLFLKDANKIDFWWDHRKHNYVHPLRRQCCQLYRNSGVLGYCLCIHLENTPAHRALFRILGHVNYTLRTSGDADFQQNEMFSFLTLLPWCLNYKTAPFFNISQLSFILTGFFIYRQVYWFVLFCFLLLNFIRTVLNKEFSVQWIRILIPSFTK